MMDRDLTAAEFGSGVTRGGMSGGRRGRIYRRSWLRRLLFNRVTMYMALAGLFLAVAGGVVAYVMAKPLYDEAYAYDLALLDDVETASIIYDREGNEISRIFVENRRPVEIEQVPYHFIQALVATEDSRFFAHSGVDFIGIGRVGWAYVRGKGLNQGASTITQQLARQSFGMFEKTVERKVREGFLANRIEKQYSKSEILELYLNRIYFGSGFWGVKAAAEGYFGKDVEDLSLAESAVLCGLIKNPSKYSPLRSKEMSKKGRDYVLSRMVQEKMIAKETYAEIEPTEVVVVPRSSEGRSSYIYEMVQADVKAILEELEMVPEGEGEEEDEGFDVVGAGGFKIYTTVDMKVQRAAEKAMQKQLSLVEERRGYIHQTYEEYRREIGDYERQRKEGLIPEDSPVPRPQPEYLQGALLMMDNETGGVVAMVGGRDYAHSSYNRAVQAQRTLGTAFTPFVYAAVFEQGVYYPGTQVKDDPIDNKRVNIGGITGILGEWGAETQTNTFEGNITARRALVSGKNAATVRLGEEVGVKKVAEVAGRMGIDSELGEYPSMYLGVDPVNMPEVCLAYSAFPGGGARPEGLHLIARLENADGVTIWEHPKEAARKQVLDPIAAYQVHSCLKEALRRGTGVRATSEYGLQSFDGGGKTGTTHNYRDMWFVGYDSKVTCGVWVGFDMPKSIYTMAFSNEVALPIWTEAMNASLEEFVAQEIPAPANAQYVEMCTRSGLHATDFCYEKLMGPDGKEQNVRTTYLEVVRDNVPVHGLCDVHSKDAPYRPSGISQPLALVDPGAESEGSQYNRADASAVRIKAVTLLGEDPYGSLAPVIRAEPVDEGGGVEGEEGEMEVRRAEAVYPTEMGDERVRIRLTPPGPLNID